MTQPGPDETPSGKPAPGADGADQRSSDNEGGDPVRDPDVIQREIEQTRTELAESIDAIADRLSPKRAASRSVAAVKSQLGAVASHVPTTGPSSEDRPDAGPLLALPPGSGTGQEVATSPRRLRTNRVLLVVGGAGVVAAVAVLVKRH